MADLSAGTTVGATRRDDGWELTVDGEVVGRLRDDRVEIGGLDAERVPSGQRHVLRTDAGSPVLRIDPAGRKATWLTLASTRMRLARQRPVPLLRRWRLTRDVTGETVLEVGHTPLGARVKLVATDGLAPTEVEALVAAALLQTVAQG